MGRGLLSTLGSSANVDFLSYTIVEKAYRRAGSQVLHLRLWALYSAKTSPWCLLPGLSDI